MLLQAYCVGHEDIVRLLLVGGVVVNLAGSNVQGALSWTSEDGYGSVVKSLL